MTSVSDATVADHCDEHHTVVLVIVTALAHQVDPLLPSVRAARRRAGGTGWTLFLETGNTVLGQSHA